MTSPLLFGKREARLHQTEILHNAARLIKAEKIKVRLSHTLPLAEVKKAHELIESGKANGKVALII